VVLVSGGGAVVERRTGVVVAGAEEGYSQPVEVVTTLTGQFGEGISSSVVTAIRLN
jgi:hypothetical protein